MPGSSSADLSLAPRPAEALVIRDESVTVGFSGDLRAADTSVMRLHLRSLACVGGPAEIIVNLSEVTWIDRAGIEPLIEAHRLQQLRGADLWVDGVSPVVTRFLRSHPRLAQIFVPYQVPPAGNEPALRAMRAEIEQLREAVRSRDVIGQAKGIISVLNGCDEAAAFARLQKISQATNRKLRDVAVLIARAPADHRQVPADVAAQLRPDAGRAAVRPADR